MPPPRATAPKFDSDTIAMLVTVRDWLRFAVSAFTSQGLVYGHGTATAMDEAAFLILETLHLPIDQLEPWLDARLTHPERMGLAAIIAARISTRKPAPYLTNSAYIRGHRFYVDERVIVPRSYIGELLEGGLEGIVPDAEADAEVDAGAVVRILDLCTGGGSLAILAALAYRQAHVDAVDISADALEVATRNVRDYGLGARITQIQMQRIDPPQEVIGAFRDVQAARADKERSINEANTYRNQVLPRAKGEASAIIQRGEAYKAQTVAIAKGDAQRFDQVYEQYSKAKDITAQRLYIETMENVLKSASKVMVDKSSQGVVPYLPLPELKPGMRPAPPAAAPVVSAPSGGTR